MRKLWTEIRFYIAIYIAVIQYDIKYRKMKRKGLILWN